MQYALYYINQQFYIIFTKTNYTNTYFVTQSISSCTLPCNFKKIWFNIKELIKTNTHTLTIKQKN